MHCCAESLLLGDAASDCVDTVCRYVPECCVGERIRCGLGELMARMLYVGCKLTLSRIVPRLSWQDFEDLVSYMVELAGYSVLRDIRVGGGQYDVVAVAGWHALIIEAKKWKVYGGRIGRVVRDHVDRVARDIAYMRRLIGDKRVYPIVVTAHDIGVRLVLGVPVVSIGVLAPFLREFDDHKDELLYF